MRRFRRRPLTMSMRQLLAALVLATALPLLGLSFIMIQRMVTSERAAIQDGQMTSTVSLAALVDNEIETHVAIAVALAASPSLASLDLAAFKEQAVAAAKVIPGGWVTLLDASRNFVMTTLAGAPAPFPPGAVVPEATPRRLAIGEVRISDLVPGPVSRRLSAFVEIPVLEGGQIVHYIVIGLEPKRFLSLIQGKIGPEGAVAIIDRQRRFIARIPDHELRLGTLAAVEWRAQIDLVPQGTAVTTTLEGRRSLTSYAPIRPGWTVGISSPLDVMDAPVRRLIDLTLVLGLASVGLSLLGATLVARVIGRSMNSLVGAAHASGRGEVPVLPPLPVREAGAVGEALRLSAEEIARRRREVQASEARFRGIFENAAVGVALVGPDGGWRRVNDRLCAMTGHAPEEMARLTLADLSHPDDMAEETELIRRIFDGEIPSYAVDKRLMCKDGGVIWVGVTASSQQDAVAGQTEMIYIARDITERKRAQAHQRFLLRELAHRSKNQLAVIQSIAAQTGRYAASVEGFLETFLGRIQGLAVATEVLLAQQGAGAPLEGLARRQLRVFLPAQARLVCAGPDLILNSEATETLGLVFHELATNAVKHGAWSNQTGMVSLTWQIGPAPGFEEPQVVLTWLESGGPPVAAPGRKGFGTIVIERMVAQKLSGRIEMGYGTDGFHWRFAAPLSALIQREGEEDGPAATETPGRVGPP